MDDFVLFGGHSFEDMVLTVQQEGSLHLVLQLHIVLRRQAETCPKTQKGKDFFETCHIHSLHCPRNTIIFYSGTTELK